ncbi:MULTISPECIES: phosphatase PAP2 family protein [Streptomyces]|uniref:Phosphatase PAP2 family protein n=1 Tax=Streptomyces cyaneofuscatus TaxID=66883 RepID=A0ABZ1F5W3_9ACTN|nr:phosphatase PAP2 family protein [Streptomyces cyaneofuscatus]WSB11731.1 phosphatase PAP2 family protein [Streptomyces cyaneofuscatus]WSD44736.1 phosphatase PAP2 family protein [Streptomyces cyaneofuscatus]WTA87932.1 phosphatase PAP2 family protein [Streptomyces cyaneofuscatus]
MPTRPTAPHPQEQRTRRADRRFGIRLLGAVAAAAAAAIPFALLLVLVEASWPPLRRVDAGAARRLHEVALEHPAWTGTLRILSDWVWDPATLRIAVALLTLWLLYRRAWRLAAWAAVTATGGALTGVLVKVVVERARPSLEDPVAQAPGYSFPSGHAMTATTSFAVLLLVLLPMVPRAWRVLCWGVAAVSVLGVGFTRIALGVHWFSDVIGGWLLGAAVVVLTGWAFEAWRADSGRRPTSVAEGLEPELTDEDPEPPAPVGRG